MPIQRPQFPWRDEGNVAHDNHHGNGTSPLSAATRWVLLSIGGLVLTALAGIGHWTVTTTAATASRMGAIEVEARILDARLQRMEAKIDWLIEQRKRE